MSAEFKHVFVCLQRKPPGMPSCGDKGSDQIFQKFQEELMMKNLFDKMAVTPTGCLGPCMMGPTVVVYPDAVWYGNVKPEDVPEIIEKHIIGGEPVERLVTSKGRPPAIF
ncbi:(2Fe-2S) ferredoxin domain-containing protein [Persephonella sp.]|nr:(2Fe-2S) ferredoxin domain-containing protein [Aquificota bacterium]